MKTINAYPGEGTQPSHYCSRDVGMSDQWRDTKVPETRCPYCDHYLDAAGDPKGVRGPQEGDLSVCISCAQVLVFTADLTVRKPTLVELHEAEADPMVRRFQEAVRQIDRRPA
jgi:hypothetical protein